MPNGNFEPLVHDITNKLANEGINGVSEKELLVLMVFKIDNINFLMHKPPWKMWTAKEVATGGVVLLGIVGAVSWSTVSQIISAVSGALGG